MQFAKETQYVPGDGAWICFIRRVTYAGSVIVALIFYGGSQARAQSSWSATFKGIGTFSSPRVADLNGDGIGDVVLGAGREEFKSCDSAVIALDGVSGKMLWHVPAIDQIFGSPSFLDINGDRVPDVFIPGRSTELFAIDGRTGAMLWKFNKKQGKQKWYNFYQPQFIKDQDHDGLPDLLISNGGNVMAEPYDEKKKISRISCCHQFAGWYPACKSVHAG